MKRKEKENQNQPEINISELWLRMREPTGAGSGKLLRDTSVSWAQKLRRRVDTARASLEWMPWGEKGGVVGEGEGRQEKKERGRKTKRREERERQKERKRTRKGTIRREADRGRLEEGGQETRGAGEGTCSWLTVTQASRIHHGGTKGAARRRAVSKQAVSHPPRPATKQPHTRARRGHVCLKPILHKLTAPRGFCTSHKEHPRKEDSRRTVPVSRGRQIRVPWGLSTPDGPGFDVSIPPPLIKTCNLTTDTNLVL